MWSLVIFDDLFLVCVSWLDLFNLTFRVYAFVDLGNFGCDLGVWLRRGGFLMILVFRFDFC